MYKFIHPGLTNLLASGDEWEINIGESNLPWEGMEKPLLLCRLVYHKSHPLQWQWTRASVAKSWRLAASVTARPLWCLLLFRFFWKRIYTSWKREHEDRHEWRRAEFHVIPWLLENTFTNHDIWRRTYELGLLKKLCIPNLLQTK